MDNHDVRPTSRFWQPDDGVKILRFEMYDTLLPGGSGVGKTIDWDGEAYITSTRSRTLYDPFGQCFAIGSQNMPGDLEGEKVRAYYCFDSKRWEVISEAWMLNRHGKADAAIAKGASGTVSIWVGPGGSEVDSTVNVTAYARGVAITSGKIVTVQFINGVPYVGCWE